MNMKLTRGLVLGSALGMAAMAMINKQTQNSTENNTEASNLNLQSKSSVGMNTNLGHISYDGNDNKYTGRASGTEKDHAAATANTPVNDTVITDILN
jgi:hypothetical protein